MEKLLRRFLHWIDQNTPYCCDCTHWVRGKKDARYLDHYVAGKVSCCNQCYESTMGEDKHG